MRDLKSFTRTPKSACGHKMAILVVVASVLTVTAAHAEPSAEDKQKARAAYTRANEANERGDYGTAARELALADELAPNSVTLKAALEAALDADAAVLGMELVARADKRNESGETAQVVETVRKRFSGRTGRLLVICSGTTPCQATFDGEAIAVGNERFVPTGKHRLIVSRGAATEQRDINVEPRGLTTVNGPEQASAQGSGSGSSAVWFVAGLAATVAAGVGTSILGAGTKERHDAFVEARCAEPGPASMCAQLANDGQSAQARTNLLAGLTGVLGLTTVIIGIATFTKKNSRAATVSGISVEPRKDGAFARIVVVLP
ncbi:MAG TPA: hypothetical protein PK156_00225 [Polyangium sp.]|nr:hypothetical protein [Polyangium sp.]